MVDMKRVTVTLPEDQMRAIDRIRRKEKISRSRVIQRAIDVYLTQIGFADDARAYEEGYRRRPERDHETQAFTLAASNVLASEDWS